MAENAVATEPRRSWLRTGLAPRWRWLLWSLFAVAWSAALLTTAPVEARDAVVEDEALRFSAGKLLHVGAYAFFAVLTSWLRLSLRSRRLCLLALIVHAGCMEFLQQFVGRTASWGDVGLNLSGIALGVALTWKRWLPRREELQP